MHSFTVRAPTTSTWRVSGHSRRLVYSVPNQQQPSESVGAQPGNAHR